VTTAMLVKFGETASKPSRTSRLRDDDLVGWSERKDGETTKHAGILDGFEISREEAETLIMTSRVKAGWIDSIPDRAAEDLFVTRRMVKAGRPQSFSVFWIKPFDKQSDRDHEPFHLKRSWSRRNAFGKTRTPRRGRVPRANLHRHPDERFAGGHDSLRHGPGAIVVPDIGRKLPGRGVWVTARADRVAEAVKRQAFSRGFKTKAVASESLAAEIELC